MMSKEILEKCTFEYCLLKNDHNDNLYEDSVTSDTAYNEIIYNYCCKNAKEFERIDNVLNENIFNDNINDSSIKVLFNNTYMLNLKVYANVYRSVIEIYQSSKENGKSIEESIQEYFDTQ